WYIVAVVVFILSSSPLAVLVAAIAFIVSSLLLFDEVGFLFPVSATILDYEDLSGSVYMFHGRKGLEDWLAFERGLSD
ncbi:hypothetical protein, partial [Halomonas sp. BC2]|uniref:hypothetical protein n=1 Tax=Halomonas sp. BC2 TaxID=1670449 RepID=UPI001BB08ACA